MTKNAALQKGIIVASCNSRTDSVIHFLDELPEGVVIGAEGWEYWNYPMPFGAVWKCEESEITWEMRGVFNFQDTETARRARLFCEEMRKCGAEDTSEEVSRRITAEALNFGDCGDQLRVLAEYAARIGRLRSNGFFR